MKCKDVIGKLPASLMPKENLEAIVGLCVFCGVRSACSGITACMTCWDELTYSMKRLCLIGENILGGEL